MSIIDLGSDKLLKYKVCHELHVYNPLSKQQNLGSFILSSNVWEFAQESEASLFLQ